MANTRLYGATDGADVTPNDTVTDATAITSAAAPGDPNPAGLMVTVAGNVRLKMISGNTVTLTELQPGNQYAFQYTHILSTGTTATGIKALFQ